jgi:hypothetical protein
LSKFFVHELSLSPFRALATVARQFFLADRLFAFDINQTSGQRVVNYGNDPNLRPVSARIYTAFSMRPRRGFGPRVLGFMSSRPSCLARPAGYARNS